jgi:hypothetical protein
MPDMTTAQSSSKRYSKRRASDVQRFICKAVWVLFLVALVALTISVVTKFNVGFPEKIRQAIRQTVEHFEFIVGMVFFALAVMSWKLCLHDWVSRGGKEQIVIDDNGIRRTATSPWLSLATHATDDYGFRTWYVPRATIKRLVLKINQNNLGSSTLEIHHTQGVTWMPVMDWVDIETQNETEKFFRGWQRIKGELSEDALKKIPLVHGLLEKKYQVEFQAMR